MSSASRHEFLSPENLHMLERVLHKAGFRGTEATVDPDKLSLAARFLIDLFQSGVSSEDELATALESRGFDVGSGENMTPKQEKSEAIDRWADEGGS